MSIKSAVNRYLGMASPLDWIVALTVELIGITSIHTALSFHAWNAAHDDRKTRAPFGFAVALAISYVVVSISLIVVLQVVPAQYRGWSHAIIPLLTVMSVLVFALRSSHNTRIRVEHRQHSEDVNRRWQVEDDQRKHRQELSRMKVAAKLGVSYQQPVNAVKNASMTEVDGKSDHMQRMLEARQKKTAERRQRVAQLLADGKTVQEIVAMGIGSLNTIKSDAQFIEVQRQNGVEL